MKVAFFIILTNIIFLQCDTYGNSNDCMNNNSCEWSSDFVSFNCNEFGSSSSCENYSDYGCSWEFSWGGWQNYGSSCVGGTFQIDNGSCEEIPDLECIDYNNEMGCEDDVGCGWVEDIDTGWCGNHNSAASCPNYPTCSWSCDGCWYLGECCGTYICTGGYYEIDNSYCEEVEIPECSDFNSESACNNSLNLDIDCEWTQNEIECSEIDDTNTCNEHNCIWQSYFNYSSCSDFNYDSFGCNATDECSWSSYQINCGTGTGYEDCVSQSGCSYSFLTYQCSGWTTISECLGTYVVDNSYCHGDSSYCQEASFPIGDLNQNNVVNVQDVIIIVDFILNNEYNESADVNNDNIVNVIDAIYIIDLILNN